MSRIICLRRTFEKLRQTREFEPTHVGCRVFVARTACPMPLGFQCRHPGGMPENSPAFQRWYWGPGVPSPEGTAENRQLSRLFGTQPSIRPHPAFKRLAISKSPFWTKTRPSCGSYGSNPSGIGTADRAHLARPPESRVELGFAPAERVLL